MQFTSYIPKAQCTAAVAHVAAFALLLLAARVAVAQNDDYIITPEIEKKVASAEVNGVVDERNFNSWIFGTINPPATKAPPQLPVLLAELDRICQLTPEQRNKLELAANLDYHLFLNDVEAAREKFLTFKTQQEVFGEFYSQVIRPLAMRRSSGLLGPGSLFFKVLPNTLRPDQLAAYNADQDQRKKFQYEVAAKVAILSLGDAVGLSVAEQEKLTKHVVENTPLPLVFGRQERQYVYYQLSQIKIEELKKIIPADRAEKVSRLVARYQGMKPSLISTGMLPAN